MEFHNIDRPASYIICRTFIFCVLTRSTANSKLAKHFNPVKDSTGQSLCAVDAANETKSVDELAVMYTDVVPSSAPPQVHCAWRCTNHEPCLGFNFLHDWNHTVCQFYTSVVPYRYQRTQACVFFESPTGRCPSASSASANETFIAIPGTQFLLRVLTINNWILIQNKVAYGIHSVSFTKPWADYRAGFGSLTACDNYWIGLENIYRLTTAAKYRLRVEMSWKSKPTLYYAEYSSFSVGSETDFYRLNVSGYSGNAGDAIARPIYHTWQSAGSMFSTADADNDQCVACNCAEQCLSGWWYAQCSVSRLNSDAFSVWSTTSNSSGFVVSSRMMIAVS